ncbi:MAG: hypothetical protein AMXMBFR84_34540 [Candidatus Hydrogenedentota bacterium]
MILYPPTQEGIEQAALSIRAGHIVAYPTETVYGLGVDPFNADALDRLFRAKGRDASKAILLIVGNVGDISVVATEVSETARSLMSHFWPGPLSLLLPPTERIPQSLTAGSGKICVRCPSSEIARLLCLAAGGPITSTSANRSGAAPAECVGDIRLKGVACAIDAGTLAPSEPSTVYDPDEDRIYREGRITRREIDSIRATMS